MSNTITRVPLRTFRAAVAAVEPFAARTGTRATVLIERAGGELRLTARDDADQIGHVVLDVATNARDFRIVVNAKALRRAMTALGPMRYGQGVTVALHAGSGGFDITAMKVRVELGLEVAEMFPNYRPELHAMMAAPAGSPVDIVGLHPSSLERIGGAARMLDLLGIADGLQMKRTSARLLSPILLIGGDTFLATLQPRKRRGSDTENAAAWLRRLA